MQLSQWSGFLGLSIYRQDLLKYRPCQKESDKTHSETVDTAIKIDWLSLVYRGEGDWSASAIQNFASLLFDKLYPVWQIPSMKHILHLWRDRKMHYCEGKIR